MSVLWKNDQSAPSNYSLTCLPFPNRVQLQQQVWCCQAPLCCHTTVLIYLPNQIETWLPVSSSPLLPLLQKLAGLTRPSILISFCSYFQCPDGTRCASATCAHKQVPCRLTCHTLEAASCCSKIWWSPPEAAWQSPCSKKNSPRSCAPSDKDKWRIIQLLPPSWVRLRLPTIAAEFSVQILCREKN